MGVKTTNWNTEIENMSLKNVFQDFIGKRVDVFFKNSSIPFAGCKDNPIGKSAGISGLLRVVTADWLLLEESESPKEFFSVKTDSVAFVRLVPEASAEVRNAD